MLMKCYENYINIKSNLKLITIIRVFTFPIYHRIFALRLLTLFSAAVLYKLGHAFLVGENKQA